MKVWKLPIIIDAETQKALRFANRYHNRFRIGQRFSYASVVREAVNKFWEMKRKKFEAQFDEEDKSEVKKLEAIKKESREKVEERIRKLKGGYS